MRKSKSQAKKRRLRKYHIQRARERWETVQDKTRDLGIGGNEISSSSSAKKFIQCYRYCISAVGGLFPLPGSLLTATRKE
jgi:hypothetical protein